MLLLNRIFRLLKDAFFWLVTRLCCPCRNVSNRFYFSTRGLSGCICIRPKIIIDEKLPVVYVTLNALISEINRSMTSSMESFLSIAVSYGMRIRLQGMEKNGGTAREFFFLIEAESSYAASLKCKSLQNKSWKFFCRGSFELYFLVKFLEMSYEV